MIIEDLYRQNYELRTHLVAVATSDYTDGCCNVQVAHKFRQMAPANRGIDHYPFEDLEEVPVARVNNTELKFKAGQPGWLWFNDFDTQAYIETGNPNLPLDSTRTHDFSDAVFVPAFIAKGEAIYAVVIDGDNYTIHNSSGTPRLDLNDNGFTLYNNAGVEIISADGNSVDIASPSGSAAITISNSQITMDKQVVFQNGTIPSI